jgi:DNA-binding response OmpR family regulator
VLGYQLVLAHPDDAICAAIISHLPATVTAMPVHSMRATYEALQQAVPQVLLLALEQPDGEGIDLVRVLREDMRLQRLVIVALSQRSDMRDKIQAFQAEVDDYLVLPMAWETLSWRVPLWMHRLYPFPLCPAAR